MLRGVFIALSVVVGRSDIYWRGNNAPIKYSKFFNYKKKTLSIFRQTHRFVRMFDAVFLISIEAARAEDSTNILQIGTAISVSIKALYRMNGESECCDSTTIDNSGLSFVFF